MPTLVRVLPATPEMTPERAAPELAVRGRVNELNEPRLLIEN